MILEENYEIIIDEEHYILSLPFIDEDFNLSFRRNSLADGSFTVMYNHQINDLIIVNGIEKYAAKINKSINKHILDVLAMTRKTMMKKIKECQDSFVNKDTEVLLLFNPKDEEHENRYIFTTDLILENGYYSTKFMNAFIYYMNNELKTDEDIFEASNYSDFQFKVNKIFKGINVANFKEEDYGRDKCLRVPYKTFINVLKENLNLL